MKTRETLWGWPHDRWLALGALIAALCSVWVSVCEFRAGRRHERLSAQPMLAYTYFYDEAGAGWRLHNGGLGTARLRAFRIFIDGKPVRDFGDIATALDLTQPVPFRFTNPRVGDRYAAGHENILYWVEPSAAAGELKQKWTRVNIQACYCSLYEECWLFSFDTTLDEANGEHRRDDDCSPFRDEERSRWWRG